MKSLIVVLVAVLVVVSVGSSAFADVPQLDQSQTSWVVNVDSGIHVSPTRSLCQTFTAGMPGQLVEVDMLLDSQGIPPTDDLYPATISILGTTGGVPNSSNVLWTHYYGGGLAQGWFVVDTSANAPFLTAGSVYGIAITNTDTVVGNPNDSWDVKTAGNPYPNGQIFEDRGSGWVPLTISGASYPTADAAFKTYVTVPEPATMALLGIGFMLNFIRRVRRR